MPRKARTQSSSGIYHVMIRGINKQRIFEEREDKQKYLKILSDCKMISGFKLYAYCLMDNHVHLLIKIENETIEQIFKRIGVRYAYWYNAKYQRVGHLFQDRYKSEAVEDDSYFIMVLRYIHQNPIKAGLTNSVNAYIFSSYHEYMHPEIDGLVDNEFVMSMMSLKQFDEYQNKYNEDKCLDINDQEQNFTDEQAFEIMYKVSKCKNTSEFHQLEIETRNVFLNNLRMKGLSIRQISRLTGISRYLIKLNLIQFT